MIKCVAIDDEPIALSIIGKYCEDYGDIELDCFDSPLDGIKFVIETCPDIVFLDIEMQPLNGLELARRLPKEVCRVDQSTVLTLMTLKDFMELLPSDRFIRVHRSYIVPIQKVERAGSRGIALIGTDFSIPIGRTYMKDCQEKLLAGAGEGRSGSNGGSIVEDGI